MKKLIATMIVSVIMDQPILAGPLSMDIMAVNSGPKLQDASNLDGTVMVQIQETKGANRARVGVILGGALACSLLSWLQFDRASDNEAEAALNREHGQLSRARLYGWSTAVLAAGSFGVALISLKTTHRVFPGLSFRNGEPHVGVSYVYSF